MQPNYQRIAAKHGLSFQGKRLDCLAFEGIRFGRVFGLLIPVADEEDISRNQKLWRDYVEREIETLLDEFRRGAGRKRPT